MQHPDIIRRRSLTCGSRHVAGRKFSISHQRLAIDGSRFKANTSKHKAMSYGRMTEAIRTVKEDLAKLKEDLAKANAKEDNASILPVEIKRRERRLAKIQAAKAALEREAREFSMYTFRKRPLCVLRALCG